jgi:predicted Zn-dependent protease
VPGKIFIGWVILAGVLIFAQQPTPDLALDEAASAFEQGKASEAEQKVQSVLEKHPSDLRALLLAGAILDSEQRYSQAEPYHQRALKIPPRSARCSIMSPIVHVPPLQRKNPLRHFKAGML